ncbi:response regulator [Thioalkalivibrio sp. ALMg9]|uniref:response regulator n=1 Tax=Thioalkalivibrio sp. ALMg9 TaxID=1266912 RepID=UPI00038215C9|nr:response regulator [Thioalkalivibrio sp. ALMg9]
MNTTSLAESAVAPIALLVDDDPDVLDELQGSLSLSDIPCVSARDGREALRWLQGHPGILVVVVDLRMPGMDGFALIRAIHDIAEDGARPRIVVMSGHLDADAAVTALRHDVEDVLSKPVSREVLHGAVTRAIRRAREERERSGFVDNVSSAMEHLRKQMRDMDRQLKAFGSTSHRRGAGSTQPDEIDLSDGEMLERVGEVLALQRRRLQHFPSDLFSDPAWDMLLDLTHNHLTGHATYVSSLAVGARVPLTTTSRYLDTLERLGLTTRYPDPGDRRRMRVALTDKGLASMRAYLASL